MKIIIGLVAAVVVIGGGAWYVSSQKSDNAALEGSMEQKEENAGEGTLGALIARAGSWTCTVKTDIENAPSEGVAYIADGQIRADFTSTIQGKAVVSHMISADSYIHTWSDAYPQGVKMKIPEGDAAASTEYGGVSYDSHVDYDCNPWIKDGSKFTPPSDVTFMEFDASAMPGVPEGVQMPR